MATLRVIDDGAEVFDKKTAVYQTADTLAYVSCHIRDPRDLPGFRRLKLPGIAGEAKIVISYAESVTSRNYGTHATTILGGTRITACYDNGYTFNIRNDLGKDGIVVDVDGTDFPIEFNYAVYSGSAVKLVKNAQTVLGRRFMINGALHMLHVRMFGGESFELLADNMSYGKFTAGSKLRFIGGREDCSSLSPLMRSNSYKSTTTVVEIICQKPSDVIGVVDMTYIEVRTMPLGVKIV